MEGLIELSENLIKRTNDERPIQWKSSEENEDEFYISYESYTIMIQFSPVPLKSYTLTVEKTEEDSLSETISIYEDEYLYNKIHKLFLSIRNSVLLKKLKKADLIKAIKNINFLLMNPNPR